MFCWSLASQGTVLAGCLLSKGSQQTRSLQWLNKQRTAWFRFGVGQWRDSWTC